MSPSTWLVLLACLCTSLASCTSLPPPREWLAAEPSKPASVARVPGAPGVDAIHAIQRLTWTEALRVAEKRSPTVGAASERIARAEALARQASALFWPRIDADARVVRFVESADFRGRTGSDVSGSTTRTRFFTGRGSDIYSASVSANYPLYDGGVSYYARQAADESVEAARREAEAVRNELELRVSTAFINSLLAEGAITIAEESLALTQDQERRARSRETAGEGLRVDTLRFATSAAEARLLLNRSRADRRVQLAILAELLGARLADEVELVTPDEALENPDGDLYAVAMSRRPDLRALDARIASLHHAIESERAGWLPHLELFGSYGLLKFDELEISQRDDELQFGSALSVNLFEGGAQRARVAALRAERNELVSRRGELALRIERELEEARAELEVARENITVAAETMSLADEVLSRVSARYRAGEAQVLDVAEATVQRTRARLAHARSQADALLAQARLRRAAGLGVMRD